MSTVDKQFVAMEEIKTFKKAPQPVEIIKLFVRNDFCSRLWALTRTPESAHDNPSSTPSQYPRNSPSTLST
jgi:hypothetical protein